MKTQKSNDPDKKTSADITDENEASKSPREEMMAGMVSNSKDMREQSKADFLEESGYDPDDLIDKQTKMLEVDDDVSDEDIAAGHTVVDEDLSDELENQDEKIIDKHEDSTDTQIVSRDGGQYIQIKVNGELKEVAINDAISTLQKNENADLKLFKANQALTEARQIQQSKTSTPPDDSLKPVVDKEALKSTLDNLYNGDVDDAVEGLAKILNTNVASEATVPTNLDELVNEAVDKKTDFNTLKLAYQNFTASDEFKAIANDPTLMNKVDDYTTELRQDVEFMSEKPSYEEIFTEAGNRTKKWLESITPTPVPVEQIDTRLEQKRSKPKAVRQQTQRRGPAPGKPKVSSREDYFEKQRQLRGQSD